VLVLVLRETQTNSSQAYPVPSVMLGVLGSAVQFERAIMRERQAEGIERAKERGAYKGRAPPMNEASIEQAREMIVMGEPKADVARRLGVSRATLYRYLP